MPARLQRRPEITRTLTLGEFHAEARDRFGDDQRAWAYQCPACGDIARWADVRFALSLTDLASDRPRLTAEQVLAQRCINCPANARDAGTTLVVLDDGRSTRVFELAPAADLPHPR